MKTMEPGRPTCQAVVQESPSHSNPSQGKCSRGSRWNFTVRHLQEAVLQRPIISMLHSIGLTATLLRVWTGITITTIQTDNSLSFIYIAEVPIGRHHRDPVWGLIHEC